MHSLRVEHGPDQVVTVLIDRPETRNAFSQEMWLVLRTLLAELEGHPVRVLVVRSAVEGVFCSGADLREYRANAGDVAWGVRSQDRVQAALGALRQFPAPTVALVDGPCVGGGAGVAMACDFRLCSDRATFALPPAKLGLVFPLAELIALRALVGPATAKAILFTGRTFTAQRAREVGFVDEVHPVEDLPGAAERLVAELCSTAPGSVRAMKVLLRMIEQGDPGLAAAADRAVAKALAGPEHLEGVTAFLERRAPRFTVTDEAHVPPLPPQ